jgi:hypothetical protein
LKAACGRKFRRESMPKTKTDKEVLMEIGNIIGAPTTMYFGASEVKEWRERAHKISALIQWHLGIPQPAYDSEKYRQNPGIKRIDKPFWP